MSKSFQIAGATLDALSAGLVFERLVLWRGSVIKRPRTICFVNAFSIVTAAKDPEFLKAINSSDLAVLDGAPLAWMGRLMTGMPCDRLSGPDFMHALLTRPEYSGLRHFVLGGSQAALDRLEFKYNRGGTASPRKVVGTWSPPFRELTPEEERGFVDRMAELRPDVLWVCLGTARQEKWMARMREILDVPVMAGVGAAVDFLSGNKPRAPRWMQSAGLEWLFRLVSEPRRLWRRYLVGNVRFLRLALMELWRHRAARRQRA
ncbi:MAG TPA: WecB/TagA/CpsF family glycosyltransferase [Candidatus Polarisedimenticolia bacterium]|nr:WecB/TagA/CpsF family glycosyltransferase [Candidatus Polarisedimenticolia bacterium]